jgi:predicted DNA-binding helix-hairpin-helix protein
VPGLGAKTVDRLLSARRHRSIRSEDLARLRLPLAKLLPFLVTADHRPHGGLLDRADLRRIVAPRTGFAALARPVQLALL